MGNLKRKDIRKQVKEAFLVYKKNKKKRKQELSNMSTDKRRTEIKKDKAQAKKDKINRKEYIKTLKGPEKRQEKYKDKYFKKLRRRPIKYSAWGTVTVLILVGLLLAAPLIGDVFNLLSLAKGIDTSTPEGVAAREAGELLAKNITDEGIILLKNTDDLLPLKDKTVNIFGTQAHAMRLSGGGSGAADTSRAINFFDALNNAGIEYNEALVELTASVAKEGSAEANESGEVKGHSGLGAVLMAMFMPPTNDEAPIDYLTDDVISDAKAFSSNALIVLTSDSVEASDAEPDQLTVKGNKLDLIEKVATEFENVVIIVNAGNALELGFINDYPSIKSVLYVGTPGATGPTSLAEIIVGSINPSGRLTDTILTNNASAPAYENFGDWKYDNIVKDNGASFATMEYEEGIYVGYRYFETRYQNDEKAYNDLVVYPFGFGLSYTDFEWEVIEHNFDNEQMQVTVKVTNTGDMAGKDVVQIYFEPPYYEGGIEKSAIELIDYAKTDTLEPGQSQHLTLTFSARSMASWDMEEEEAYVLDEGSYQINISRNVQETVKSLEFILEEKIVYKTAKTGQEYKNYFDYANGGLTYLSRSDWEGTYPTSDDINTHADDELYNTFDAYWYPERNEVPGEMPILDADNGIMLTKLKGLDFDDPMWSDYMDQFTYEELRDFYSTGGWQTIAIDRLGIPKGILLDGPAGINYFFGDMTSAAYPAALLLASTWNDDLVYEMGVSLGTEARVYGVHALYAPAMNIHRTAYGGRNFEYYSEDPLISGRMGAAIIKGIQSQDVAVTMKHFIANDQEINARSGLFTWMNEQALREIYLEPFAIALEENDVSGVMSSFIHLGHKWAGANTELLNDVLRGELGFTGFVVTDAVQGGFMKPNLSLRGGSDLMLAPIPTSTAKIVDDSYDQDPIGTVTGLKDRVHTILHTMLNKTRFAD